MLRFSFTLCCFALWALPLGADPLMGLWLTPPDAKGQIAHVQVRRCDGGFCGKIVEVRAATGGSIQHKNLGKDLFWAMRPQGGGRYVGQGWLPKNNLRFNGEAQVVGDRLTFRGCAAGICKNQTWQRLR